MSVRTSRIFNFLEILVTKINESISMGKSSTNSSSGGMGSSNNNNNNNNNHGSSVGGSKAEALRKMNKLVTSLINKQETAPFREPVDWRALELYDYPKIVTRPMDIGTIKRKLESSTNSYETAYDCAEDIRLVWENCKVYNQEGSDFYTLASNLSRKFEDRYMKIRTEYDTGKDTLVVGGGSGGNMTSGNTAKNINPDVRIPTLDEKTQFAGNIFKISGDALGHVMQVIDLRCPIAIERNINGAEDELEINVDALDNRTFHELDTFIQEKVVQMGRKRDHSGKRKK